MLVTDAADWCLCVSKCPLCRRVYFMYDILALLCSHVLQIVIFVQPSVLGRLAFLFRICTVTYLSNVGSPGADNFMILWL